MLTIVFVLMFAACGEKQQDIVGSWKAEDGIAGEYGVGLQFGADGAMSYILSSDGEDAQTLIEALEKAKEFIEINYKIKSDTEIQITASVLFGIAKQTTEVNYSLDGDTLIFAGTKYIRVK